MKLKGIQEITSQTEYMGRGPKKSPTKRNKTSAPAQMDYAAESPFPC